MKKLMLLGARKFIDMPAGTFYIPNWGISIEKCLEVIEKFKSNPLDLLDYSNMEIYGDNNASMAFSCEEVDNIFYYDANVVGDASPCTTVYLVLSEECIPDIANYDMNGDTLMLKRDQVLHIRDLFIDGEDTDNINNPNNDWARQKLDKYSSEDETDEMIINLSLEYILPE